MKELRYTLLDLPWEYRSRTCDFCSNYSKNNGCANLIKTRHEMTNKLIAADVICKSCKEKFENDELPKCAKCGKLQTKTDLDLFSGTYVCNC